MKIYTIKFKKNGKKYAYKTSNYRKIKRLKRQVNYYLIGYYDTTDF